MKYISIKILTVVFIFFSGLANAGSMSCEDFLLSNSNASSDMNEDAVLWLTKIGLLSDGSGPSVKGAHRSIPMKIDSKIFGVTIKSEVFLAIRPTEVNDLLEVFLGGKIGEMRVLSLESDRLLLESDAASLIEYSVTVEVDRTNGQVTVRHRNLNGGISEIAHGNLSQLN